MRPDLAMRSMSKRAKRRAQSIGRFRSVDSISGSGHDRNNRHPSYSPEAHQLNSFRHADLTALDDLKRAASTGNTIVYVGLDEDQANLTERGAGLDCGRWVNSSCSRLSTSTAFT